VLGQGDATTLRQILTQVWNLTLKKDLKFTREFQNPVALVGFGFLVNMSRWGSLIAASNPSLSE